MRDILLKIAKNSREVCAVVSALNPSEIERGRLLVTPRMAESLCAVLLGESMAVSSVKFTDSGHILLKGETKGMRLSYRFFIDSLRVENGRLAARLTYEEEREGGGVGGAILGMTGKSGLALALGKSRHAKADNSSVTVDWPGLPRELRAALAGVSGGGLSLRIY